MHSGEPKAVSGTDPTLSYKESVNGHVWIRKEGAGSCGNFQQEGRGFWWLCYLPVNILQAIKGKRVHIVCWSWEKLIFRLWGSLGMWVVWFEPSSLCNISEWIIRNVLTFCPCSPIHFSSFLKPDFVLWCIHSEGSQGGLGIVSGSFPPSLTSIGALNRNVAYFAEAHEMSALQCCHS